MNAKVLSANRTEGSVLPRSIRRFEMAWIHGGGGTEDPSSEPQPNTSHKFFEIAKYQWQNFAFGMYSANLNVTFGPNNNTAKESFTFFVIPWQLLILLVGTLLLLIIIIRIFLKSL